MIRLTCENSALVTIAWDEHDGHLDYQQENGPSVAQMLQSWLLASFPPYATTNVFSVTSWLQRGHFAGRHNKYSVTVELSFVTASRI